MMAATIGNLSVVLSANSAQWAKGLARAQGNLNSFAASALSTVTSLKAQILGGLGVASAIGAGGLGVKLYSDLQSATAGFETMLGSASAAKDMIQQIRTFAEQTPFEFPELVRSSQQMMAMGFAAKDVLPLLRTIGDQAAAMGRGGEGVSQIVRALGQMKAKGVVSAEEINQLAEAGIGAWQMIADKIGTTVPKAMKMAEQRAIDSTTAISAILEGMAAKTGGSMEKQSKMIGGAWSNLKDVVGQALVNIVAEFDRTFHFAEILQTITNYMKEFSGEIQEGAKWLAQMGLKALGVNGDFKQLINAGIKIGIVVKNAFVKAIEWLAEISGAVINTIANVNRWAVSWGLVSDVVGVVEQRIASQAKTSAEAAKKEAAANAMRIKSQLAMDKMMAPAKKAAAKRLDLEKESVKVLEDLAGKEDDYAKLRDKLNEMQSVGAITTRQHALAMGQLEDKYTPVVAKMSDYLAKLREEIALYGLSDAAAERSRLEHEGAAASRLATAQRLNEQLTDLKRQADEREQERESVDAASEAQKKMFDDAQAMIREQQTPQEKYADQLKTVTKLFDAGQLSAGQATDAARRLRRELQTPIRDPNERITFEKGSAELLGLQRQIAAQARQASSFAGRTIDFRERGKANTAAANAAALDAQAILSGSARESNPIEDVFTSDMLKEQQRLSEAARQGDESAAVSTEDKRQTKELITSNRLLEAISRKFDTGFTLKRATF